MSISKKTSVAICVAGWHFNEPFYREVIKLAGDVFVISHRARRDVPEYVYRLIGKERVFIELNLGYDWGAYQQFLKKRIWRKYPYVVFMHDDVIIHDHGLLVACYEALKNFAVVGNGHGGNRSDHPAHAPQSYAHSCWKPISQTIKHEVVRGSFFATTREALVKLGHLEVFWDPFCLNERFGNWSTRASCGRWTEVLGPDCIGFLSETYRESCFMSEEERGGAGREGRRTTRWKSWLSNIVNKQATRYMEIYWMSHRSVSLVIRLRLLALSLACLSGSWGPLHTIRRDEAR